MTCGTPLVAFHGRNAAELIYDHVKGFTYDSLEEMVEMLPLILGVLQRRECRGAFEKRVSEDGGSLSPAV